MRRLIYNAAEHHTLDEGGKSIHGGEEFAVSNSRAEQLLADLTVSVYEAPDSDLANLKREELDAIAEAEATIPQPEADAGEGHDTTPQED